MKHILSACLSFFLGQAIASTMPFACEPKLYQKEPSNMEVLQLAKNASSQIFSLTSAEELEPLKSCFSSTGWESFNQALAKANTLATIKKQGLQVKSSLNKEPIITHVEKMPPSWTIKLPISVHYENNTHELTQHLAVKLTIELHAGQLSVESIQATPVKA